MKLVSERLLLRPADETDLDFYVDLRNRPEVIPWSGGDPRPRAEVERQLEKWLAQWRVRQFGAWTVFGHDGQERLGRVELDPLGPGWSGIAADEIEIGCVVHPTHWNRGVATEATLLVLGDCFDRLGLDRLVALTTTDNKQSLRALEKVGMRYVGETRHAEAGAYELFEVTAAAS